MLAILLAAAFVGVAADSATPEFDALPQAEQRILNKQRERWKDIPKEQREKLRRGAQSWLSMTPEQRRSARQRWNQWQGMSEDSA